MGNHPQLRIHFTCLNQSAPLSLKKTHFFRRAVLVALVSTTSGGHEKVISRISKLLKCSGTEKLIELSLLTEVYEFKNEIFIELWLIHHGKEIIVRYENAANRRKIREHDKYREYLGVKILEYLGREYLGVSHKVKVTSTRTNAIKFFIKYGKHKILTYYYI